MDDYHDGRLTVSKAVKGPNANAPVRGTKTRKVRRIPVDDDLRSWIQARIAAIPKEESSCAT